jgi:hypothetical protein
MQERVELSKKGTIGKEKLHVTRGGKILFSQWAGE